MYVVVVVGVAVGSLILALDSVAAGVHVHDGVPVALSVTELPWQTLALGPVTSESESCITIVMLS